MDIYGRGWPEGISLEESRGEQWRDRTCEILSPYSFNICLENTNFDYYCTEKIWDSIRAVALPIYYGQGNKIYDTFPHESFIDLADFGSPEQVYDFIQSMSQEEYIQRMNRCIKVYNQWCDLAMRKRERERMLAKLAERIRTIVDPAGSFGQFAQSHEPVADMQR